MYSVLYYVGMMPINRRREYEFYTEKPENYVALSKRHYYPLHVMVCKSAFGYGINIRNVLPIIHVHRPYSKMEVLQEGGRAGRNGWRTISVGLDCSTVDDRR